MQFLEHRPQRECRGDLFGFRLVFDPMRIEREPGVLKKSIVSIFFADRAP